MDQYYDLKDKIDDLEFDLRQKERENIKLTKIIDGANKRKKINIALASFGTIISIAVGAMANSLYSDYKMIKEGKREIAQDVYENCMSDIGWNNNSNGYSFNEGNHQIDYEEFKSTIKARARANDISDIDLYIGVSDIINDIVAEDLVGKYESDEINDRAYVVYLDSELEREKANAR